LRTWKSGYGLKPDAVTLQTPRINGAIVEWRTPLPAIPGWGPSEPPPIATPGAEYRRSPRHREMIGPSAPPGDDVERLAPRGESGRAPWTAVLVERPRAPVTSPCGSTEGSRRLTRHQQILAGVEAALHVRPRRHEVRRQAMRRLLEAPSPIPAVTPMAGRVSNGVPGRHGLDGIRAATRPIVTPTDTEQHGIRRAVSASETSSRALRRRYHHIATGPTKRQTPESAATRRTAAQQRDLIVAREADQCLDQRDDRPTTIIRPRRVYSPFVRGRGHVKNTNRD